MNGQVSAQVVAIAYTIWHARNISIYENRDLPEEEIIKRVQTCMEEYQQANNRLQDVRSGQMGSENNPFQTYNNDNLFNLNLCSWVIVRCDASLKENGIWGISATFRDDCGRPMAAATWKIDGFRSPVVADAVALYRQCSFQRNAASLQYALKVWIEEIPTMALYNNYSNS